MHINASTNMHTCTHTHTCLKSFPLIPGYLKAIPSNCRAISDDYFCMMYVKRGQSVTLCTSFISVPSTIPQGKHAFSVSKSQWLIYKNTQSGPIPIPLYNCSRESCTQGNSPNVNYTHYSNVTDSCLTIDNLQETEEYFFSAHFHPCVTYNETRTIFLVLPAGMSACVWSTMCYVIVCDVILCR